MSAIEEVTIVKQKQIAIGSLSLGWEPSAMTTATRWVPLTDSPPLILVTSATPPPLLLVLVISTSSYDSITYYHGLPYLLPTCSSFITAL